MILFYTPAQASKLSKLAKETISQVDDANQFPRMKTMQMYPI